MPITNIVFILRSFTCTVASGKTFMECGIYWHKFITLGAADLKGLGPLALEWNLILRTRTSMYDALGRTLLLYVWPDSHSSRSYYVRKTSVSYVLYGERRRGLLIIPYASHTLLFYLSFQEVYKEMCCIWSFYNSRPNHINCLIIGHVTVKMKIPFVTVNNALQWLFIRSLERVERLVWLSPPQPLSGMNYPWAVKDMKRNVLHVCPSMALIVVL